MSINDKADTVLDKGKEIIDILDNCADFEIDGAVFNVLTSKEWCDLKDLAEDVKYEANAIIEDDPDNEISALEDEVADLKDAEE